MDFLTLLLLLPLFFIINFSILYLWIALYIRNRNSSLCYTSSLVSFVAFGLVLLVLLILNSPYSYTAFELMIIKQSSATLYYQILTVVLFLIYTLASIKNENFRHLGSLSVELIFIRLVVLISLLILSVSDNLVAIFFFLEVYALSSYVLVAYKGKISIFSSESGIKYFIVGTVFSLLMVYGISLIYSSFGTLSLTILSTIFLVEPTSSIAVLFILSGLLFKLAVFPLHIWSPDVYEGAPTNTMYFLSVIPKPALFLILIKFNILITLANLAEIVCVCAIGSIIIGCVAGVYQKRIKRLLAYSSINNSGFILLSILSLNICTLDIATFFITIYVITSNAVFLVLLTMKTATAKITIKNLSNLSNFYFTQRARAIIMSLFLFSSAGLPPLVGFISKFLIFLSLSWSYINFILPVVLILSALSVFYYIRILKTMAFAKKNIFIFLDKISPILSLFICFSVILVVSLMFISGTFLLFFHLLTY